MNIKYQVSPAWKIVRVISILFCILLIVTIANVFIMCGKELNSLAIYMSLPLIILLLVSVLNVIISFKMTHIDYLRIHHNTLWIYRLLGMPRQNAKTKNKSVRSRRRQSNGKQADLTFK